MKHQLPKAKGVRCLLFLLLLGCFTVPAAADPTINFQGMLTDSLGNPVESSPTNEIQMVFRIFNVETDGTALWEEAHPAVDVVDGIYSVLLGSITSFPVSPDLFDNDALWLEIEVNSETLLPRRRLTSTPYSLRSKVAESVVDGAVTAAKIGENCAEGEVLVKTVSGWACGPLPCVPAAEVCDGLDNDCNGTVDDGVSGPPCTLQAGVCAGSTSPCGGASGFLSCERQDYGPDYEVIEESCDGLDNDCDGAVDDGLTAPPCALQTGVCAGARSSCGGSNGFLACTAQDYGPDYEAIEVTCDNQDNDCNGIVDDAWTVGGVYESDQACGNCSTDCTAIYDLPNASGYCESSTGTPTCVMSCDAGYYDQNQIPGDGCEFSIDPGSIYVSADDPAAADDAGCGLVPFGTGYPCLSVTRGLERAQSTGRKQVFVADGFYPETISLVNGIDLLGGYSPNTWTRHLSTTNTVLTGSSLATHKQTVIAQDITLPTLFEGFAVKGMDNLSSGGNSYGIWVRNSTAGLVIRNNRITAGRGGDGERGSSGLDGSDGGIGGPGSDALDLFDEWGVANHDCTSVNHSPGGFGGVSECGGIFTSGGEGGNRVCPTFDGTETGVPVASEHGLNGQNGGGVGGAPGRDVYHQAFPATDTMIMDSWPGLTGLMDSLEYGVLEARAALIRTVQ